MREKIGKSRFTVFFQWFVAPEGRKVGSLKRRVRSQLARWDMKKCTPLWREAHFQVKMDKTLEERTTFGSCDVEKVHAVVARSTFWSQNVQNTPWSDHFWKLRCRKSARRCGAKHISKSKCTKHHMFAPLLEVRMLEKCTPLWREAHFQVKMHKTHHVRTTFGVWDVEFRKSARRCGAKQISKSECPKHTMFGPLLESEMSSFEKVHAVVARSTVPSQNVKNTRVSDHFWRFRCPSDVSTSRCRGSLVLATADRNRRLPLCWRAPSCRQKYRKTWRNVTRPIPPTCLPHGVAAACFVLATADKKAETHNHLSIHQWVRSAIFAPQQHASPIGFLFLKLPPPPCAVLLVCYICNHIYFALLILIITHLTS